MITKDIKLHIIYKFNGLYYIVATDSGIYQLQHCNNNRTKPFRELKQVLIGGSIGYRINRKFYTKNKLNKLAYKYQHEIIIGKIIESPF